MLASRQSAVERGDVERPRLPADVVASLRGEHQALVIPWAALELECVVARGAFGRVLKGKHAFFDVAVKELEHVGETSTFGGLLTELQVMRALTHPHLLSPPISRVGSAS